MLKKKNDKNEVRENQKKERKKLDRTVAPK